MKTYSDIVQNISEYFKKTDERMSELLSGKENILNNELCEFVVNNSKKIRSALVFYVTKALEVEISERQIMLSCALELIHNASLIHDDVIDKSETRRGHDSLHAKYDNSVSVVAGDYLFSVALDVVENLNNKTVSKMFIDTMKTLCSGEIYQYFNRGKVPEFSKYIEKSYNKTAKLFELAINSAVILSGKDVDLKEFARLFGIVFQIKDDYNNIYIQENATDIYNGIYTAPVIFAKEDFPDIEDFSQDKILETVKQQKYQTMTKSLIENHVNSAIENISCLQDNEFKVSLIELCNFLKVG